MHRRTSLVRAVLAVAIAALIAGLLTLVGPAGSAGAEETPEPEVGSPDDETPEAPPPAGSVTPAAEADVDTETEYRNAIIAMNASGTPNTLNITGSFVMDDGGNPDYTGSQPLTINGNGNTVDMDDSGAFLNLFTSAAVVINDLTLTNGRENGDGGALDIVDDDIDVTLNNVTFITNFADSDGGAIDFDGDDATLTINGGLFQLNESDGSGGAIQMDGEGQTLTTNGTTFDQNLAPSGSGGAINDNGDGTNTVDVRGSTFTGNRAPGEGDGGAIDAEGDLSVNPSTFIGNEAGFQGGAIDIGADDENTHTIVDSLFIQNIAEDNGGAYSESGGGITTIDGSTFDRNEAREGGALELDGDEGDTVTNSTLTANIATRGGGIYTGDSDDVFTLTHLTITDNSAPDGAQVTIDGEGDQMITFGTLFSGATGGGENCELAEGATVDSQGYNYSTDDSCDLGATGDTENGGDPEIEALGDFGGPTPTRPPLVTSPLVDAIPEADCVLDIDQRDVPRPQDGNLDGTTGCDIGAVEVLVETPEEPGAGPIAAAPGFTG